jgi:hypothetical protein
MPPITVSDHFRWWQPFHHSPFPTAAHPWPGALAAWTSEHGPGTRNEEQKRGRGWEKSWGLLGFTPATPLWWVEVIGMHHTPTRRSWREEEMEGDKNRRFNCRPCWSSDITRRCTNKTTRQSRRYIQEQLSKTKLSWGDEQQHFST